MSTGGQVAVLCTVGEDRDQVAVLCTVGRGQDRTSHIHSFREKVLSEFFSGLIPLTMSEHSVFPN